MKKTLQQQLEEAKDKLRICIEVCREADKEFLLVANKIADLGVELGLLKADDDSQADVFIQDLVDKAAFEQEKELCRAISTEMRANDPICRECGICMDWCDCN